LRRNKIRHITSSLLQLYAGRGAGGRGAGGRAAGRGGCGGEGGKGQVGAIGMGIRDKKGVAGVWLIDKQAGTSHIQQYIRA
jgi:hypothetical protein